MMSSNVEPQVALVMVQRSVALVPAGTPVMVVVADAGVVIEAVPLWSVHTPVPGAAAFAVLVKVATLQFSTLGGPASATGGCASLVSVMSVKLGVHSAPLVTVQRTTALVPAGTPVTVVVREEGLVMKAVPL